MPHQLDRLPINLQGQDPHVPCPAPAGDQFNASDSELHLMDVGFPQQLWSDLSPLLVKKQWDVSAA